MNRITLIIILIYTCTNSIFSQTKVDSLIRFSDLRYDSDFEKAAMINFVRHNKDTFNLFLAIDDKMTEDEANSHYKTYLKLYDDLNQKNINEKKLNTKIKVCYSTVHSLFLKKYNNNEYFPVVFQSGTYNCVSASMLYAMVFDKLKIPYKVMVSSDHVYLIANPGSNSIVIETTNPSFEKAIFTGEFKQQYVSYLRTSKMISEDDYKNKSIEEIFEEKYNEVKEATFNNLPGFQYYNEALTKLQLNDIDEALKLCQKAYFFFPDERVKQILNTALIMKIEKCNFDKVSDIDYLAQFSRFENTDLDVIVNIFRNIIFHLLQYTDKENYCDSLYQRLIPQISDKKTLEEISFAYYMQMGYRYQNSDKVEKYITKALKIKGNHNDANIIIANYLLRKLYSISNPQTLLDTIKQMETRYEALPTVINLTKDHKLTAYLKMAQELYGQKKITDGDKYLQDFESRCTQPITNNIVLEIQIGNTYQSASFYYNSIGNRSKAKSYIDRGLKYAPNSKVFNSMGY